MGRSSTKKTPAGQAANQSLWDDRRFLASLIQESVAAIAVVDLEGRIVFANERGQSVLGLTKAEVLQRTYNAPQWKITDFDGNPFPDDQLPFNQVMQTKQAVFNIRHAIEWPDGTRKYLSIDGSPLHNESGQLVGVSFAIVDITETHLAEKRLQESEAIYRQLFEEQRSVMLLIDPKSLAIADANRAATRFYGYELNRLKHMTIADLTTSPNGEPLAPAAQVIYGYQGTFLYCHRLASGEVRQVEVNSSPLTRNGKTLIHLIIHDISERQRAETNLRSRHQELRILHEISEMSLGPQSAQTAFQDLATTISSATGFPWVAIEWYDAPRQVMTISAITGATVPVPTGTEVPSGQTRSGRVAMLGQPLMQWCAPDEPPIDDVHPYLRHQCIRTFIGLPMKVDQRVIGVLSLAHSDPIPPDQHLIEWVSSLANYIASLTERHQVAAAIQLHHEQAQLVGTITQHIRQSLNLDEILQTAVSEVQQFLHADRVIICRLTPSSQTSSVVAEARQPPYASMLGWTFHTLEEASPSRETATTIQTIVDLHQSDLDPGYIQLLRLFGVKSQVTLPLLHGTQLWGRLIIQQCDQHRQWQAWEVDALKHMEAQLAVAIQQAELYRQVRELNADLEGKVKERTIQLWQLLEYQTIMQRVTEKVRDSLDEDHILQTVVEELGQVLPVTCCETGIYDLQHATQTITHEYTISTVSGLNHRLPTAEIADVHDQLLRGQSVQFCPLVPLSIYATEQLYTMLACPIRDDHGMLGILWLLRDRHEEFNPIELRLVRQIANQCEIAIRQSRLYRAAQQQVEELERLNLLKDDFLSTISHELRTPLSSIRVATQLLDLLLHQTGLLPAADSTVEIAPKVEHSLQVLRTECDREINLINDLLTLQQLGAGTYPLVPTAIQLTTWVPHVVATYEEEVASHHQTLQVNIPPNLPNLITDLTLFNRILDELLANACKFTPAHGAITIAASHQQPRSTPPAPRPNLEPHEAQLASVFHITVTNTGGEIPASELPFIFNQFYRVPSADPWKHGGMGLGLALVKKMVAYLKGEIWAESSAGQIRVTIALPATIRPLI